MAKIERAAPTSADIHSYGVRILQHEKTTKQKQKQKKLEKNNAQNQVYDDHISQLKHKKHKRKCQVRDDGELLPNDDDNESQSKKGKHKQRNSVQNEVTNHINNVPVVSHRKVTKRKHKQRNIDHSEVTHQADDEHVSPNKSKKCKRKQRHIHHSEVTHQADDEHVILIKSKKCKHKQRKIDHSDSEMKHQTDDEHVIPIKSKKSKHKQRNIDDSEVKHQTDDEHVIPIKSKKSKHKQRNIDHSEVAHRADDEHVGHIKSKKCKHKQIDDDKSVTSVLHPDSENQFHRKVKKCRLSIEIQYENEMQNLPAVDHRHHSVTDNDGHRRRKKRHKSWRSGNKDSEQTCEVDCGKSKHKHKDFYTASTVSCGTQTDGVHWDSHSKLQGLSNVDISVVISDSSDEHTDETQLIHISTPHTHASTKDIRSSPRDLPVFVCGDDKLNIDDDDSDDFKCPIIVHDDSTSTTDESCNETAESNQKPSLPFNNSHRNHKKTKKFKDKLKDNCSTVVPTLLTCEQPVNSTCFVSDSRVCSCTNYSKPEKHKHKLQKTCDKKMTVNLGWIA